MNQNKLVIAILDSEEQFLANTINTLRAANFEAIGFKDSISLLKALLKDKIDLLLLDLAVNSEDIHSIQRYTTIVKDLITIVFYTNATEKNRVDILNSGAERILEKPISQEELLANIKSALRHINTNIIDTHETQKPWKLITETWLLISPDNQTLKLTAREFNFLKTLINAKGDTVDKNLLAETVIGKRNSNRSEKINLLLTRLRKKANDACIPPLPIKTAHTIGYAFTSTAIIE